MDLQIFITRIFFELKKRYSSWKYECIWPWIKILCVIPSPTPSSFSSFLMWYSQNSSVCSYYSLAQIIWRINYGEERNESSQPDYIYYELIIYFFSWIFYYFFKFFFGGGGGVAIMASIYCYPIWYLRLLISDKYRLSRTECVICLRK